MNTFRTRRPLLVKASQCTQDDSIVTDLGKRPVHTGDWIIEGENHEQYVVDDTFFQHGRPGGMEEGNSVVTPAATLQPSAERNPPVRKGPYGWGTRQASLERV